MKISSIYKALFFLAVSMSFTACFKNDDGIRLTEDVEKQIAESIASVDLGLSVKWATCNLGAIKPEANGRYYAWGETTFKEFYDWSNYKWCDGTIDYMTKYNNRKNNGAVDYKTTLDLEDDVAHVKLGDKWRIPTEDEWTELINCCTWTWTTRNGVNGYQVTSNKSGYTSKSIFLPAAGVRYHNEFRYIGTYGDYWSSSLCSDISYHAYQFRFDTGSMSTCGDPRFVGQCVRPVSE